MIRTSDDGIVIFDLTEWQIVFKADDNGVIPVIPREVGEIDQVFLLVRPGLAVTLYTTK